MWACSGAGKDSAAGAVGDAADIYACAGEKLSDSVVEASLEVVVSGAEYEASVYDGEEVFAASMPVVGAGAGFLLGISVGGEGAESGESGSGCSESFAANASGGFDV